MNFEVYYKTEEGSLQNGPDFWMHLKIAARIITKQGKGYFTTRRVLQNGPFLQNGPLHVDSESAVFQETLRSTAIRKAFLSMA